MDAERFDALLRSRRAQPTRRRMLGGLTSGLLAASPLAFGRDGTTAAPKRKHKHPSTCCDGIQNGAETDLDCGGPDCPPCGPGRVCATNTDCSTARCGDALGDGSTCQVCTGDGVCGRDSNGGCLCDAATGACLTNAGTLPARGNCAGCPPRTVCTSSIDGFFCVPLCGG